MAGAVIRKRFTADEYQRTGQAGILSEDDRVELIDGEVVAMTPIGARHNACVTRTTRALVMAAGDDTFVQPQGAIQEIGGSELTFCPGRYTSVPLSETANCAADMF